MVNTLQKPKRKRRSSILPLGNDKNSKNYYFPNAESSSIEDLNDPNNEEFYAKPSSSSEVILAKKRSFNENLSSEQESLSEGNLNLEKFIAKRQSKIKRIEKEINDVMKSNTSLRKKNSETLLKIERFKVCIRECNYMANKISKTLQKHLVQNSLPDNLFKLDLETPRKPFIAKEKNHTFLREVKGTDKVQSDFKNPNSDKACGLEKRPARNVPRVNYLLPSLNRKLRRPSNHRTSKIGLCKKI